MIGDSQRKIEIYCFRLPNGHLLNECDFISGMSLGSIYVDVIQIYSSHSHPYVQRFESESKITDIYIKSEPNVTGQNKLYNFQSRNCTHKQTNNTNL